MRALLDYDEHVMLHALCQQPQSAPGAGLAEVVRACAPLVTYKGDWAALFMLLREQGRAVGYTELCRLIAEYAPQAPQPRKQDISHSEWMTGHRRFPDWPADVVKYGKYRRHYAIAARALERLTKM